MTCNAEVKVHIKTNTADSPPLTSHNNVCDVKYLRWNCSLEHKGPDTTISLWPTSKSGAYPKYVPRQFRSMYVLNSHGNQVGGIAVNSSDVQEKVSSGKCFNFYKDSLCHHGGHSSAFSRCTLLEISER